MTKYGIATDNGRVAAHFGRCPTYTIVDVVDGKVTKKEEVSNPGHRPGAIPKFMNEQGIDVMIAGGMGRRAIQFFNQFGIEVMVGVSGSIAGCLDTLKSGDLEGGESTCSPRSGKGYGIPREDAGQHDH